MNGGEGEIRTRGALSGSSAFEAGAFNHSATSPHYPLLYTDIIASKALWSSMGPEFAFRIVIWMLL